jgi:hypothetical protein
MKEMLTGVAKAQAEIVKELEGVTDAQSRFRPPGGGEDEDAWGIAEVLRHLIQSQEGNAVRIARLARGEEAEGSVPGALGGREAESLSELAAALSASYAAFVGAVEGVAGSERLDTTALHPIWGEMNCREWLALAVVHYRSHARQIAQIKAGAGYPR